MLEFSEEVPTKKLWSEYIDLDALLFPSIRALLVHIVWFMHRADFNGNLARHKPYFTVTCRQTTSRLASEFEGKETK